jgi:chorismate mutase
VHLPARRLPRARRPWLPRLLARLVPRRDRGLPRCARTHAPRGPALVRPAHTRPASQPKRGATRGALVRAPGPAHPADTPRSPDEYPFTPPGALPPPVLPPLRFPRLLHANTVNANASILAFYTRAIVPRIAAHAGADTDEDDGNYGSTATLDIEVLQAVSKRVHYGACCAYRFLTPRARAESARARVGKFVSESKFRADPAAFIPHIRSRNTDALAALITKPEVERRLLLRLRKKVRRVALCTRCGPLSLQRSGSLAAVLTRRAGEPLCAGLCV